MNPEERLAAIEADLLAIKQRLGMTSPRSGPAVLPQVTSEPPVDRLSITPPPLAPGLAAAAPVLPSQEVRLGGYWVTRIGAVLVLLGAIFLAAYLSIYSRPTIRIGELAAAAAVTLGIAYWQQARDNLRFALVLHSLGDALVFFTAFAAYAFDPTRVIDGVNAAIAVQTVAGACVCAHALHRRSEGSAVFSLVLLTWVAGFSLDYQHSDTTLGYIAALALIGSILRLRFSWNLPLAFATVTCPVLGYMLAGNFPSLRLPLEITFALLPLVAALPIGLGRTALNSGDRAVVYLALAANLAAALLLRYGVVPDAALFHHQLLIEAGAFGIVAALFAARPREGDLVRRGLTFAAAYFGAVSAALYLLAQFPHAPWASLAILAVGAGTAWGLRSGQRWLPGMAYLVFCGLSQLWFLGQSFGAISFGTALYWAAAGSVVVSAALLQIALREPESAAAFSAIGLTALVTLGIFAGLLDTPVTAVPTLVAGVLLAGIASSRFLALRPWALMALVVAHLVIIGSRGVRPDHWLLCLLLITAVDAAVLLGARPLRTSVLHPLPLTIALCMLGTLFYGYATAHLEWSATFIWVPLAAATFLLGFWQRNPSYRVAALVAFAPCLIRLFADDLNSAFTRIVASFLLGIILLGVGYLYTRLSRFHRAENR